MFMRTTCNKLAKQIVNKIQKVESLIDYLLSNHATLKQNCDNLQTIPGIDKTTAVAILAEAPDVNFFHGARQFAAYAGLTPAHKTSGSS